jgi:hypothetical protein
MPVNLDEEWIAMAVAYSLILLSYEKQELNHILLRFDPFQLYTSSQNGGCS